MLEILIYILAFVLLAACIFACIYYIIVIPNREGLIKDLIQKEYYSEAEELLKKILQKDPYNVKMSFELAEVYWKTEKFLLATDIYNELVDLNLTPNMYHTCLYRLSSWAKEQKQYQHAKEIIEKLLVLVPLNLQYLILAGDIAYELNEYSSSVDHYKKALSIFKKDLHCWTRLAESYQNLSMHMDALKAYANAVDIDKNSSYLWYQSGEVALSMGDPDKAITFFQKSERLSNSSYSFKSILQIAKIYQQRGIQADYTLYLEKALYIIQKRPDIDVEKEEILFVHYALGECYSKTNNVDLAMRQWEDILRIAPNYRDTMEIYQMHVAVRLDDFFKDMLTTRGVDLIDIISDFIKSLGYHIDSVQQFSATAIDFHVSESTSKWRDIKRRKSLLSFWCSSDIFPHDIGERLVATISAHGASDVILISSGPVLSESREILERKAVNIYDSNNIKDLIDARQQKNFREKQGV